MSNKTKYYGRLYAFQFLYREAASENISLEDLKTSLSEFEQSLETIIQEQNLSGEMQAPSKELGKIIIENFIQNKDVVQSEIKNYLHRNNFENLSSIEKTILKLGYYELKFTKDSYSEIINDYINLAKEYGKKDSYSIINGVLDSVKNSL